MNNIRRKQLEKLLDQLDTIYNDIENIQSEEQDAYDNMPENLQDSERCQNMEAAIESMDSALSSIDDVRDYLEEAISW